MKKFTRIILSSIILLCFNAAMAASPCKLIEKYSKRFDINPLLIQGIIEVESAFIVMAEGPDTKGGGYSYGLMQIKHETALDIGYKGNLETLVDQEVNIAFGIKYIKQCIEWAGGNWLTALDMYNRGVGMVRKYPWKRAWAFHPYVGKIIKAIQDKNRCKFRDVDFTTI